MLDRIRPAEFEILYLGVLPTWVRAVSVIVAVVASLLWAGRLWDVSFAHFTGWRRRRSILAQLDNLNPDEQQLTANQIAYNEQVFTGDRDSLVLVGRRHKGLVVALGDDPFDCTHTIPDFVWKELGRRWRAAQQREARRGD